MQILSNRYARFPGTLRSTARVGIINTPAMSNRRLDLSRRAAFAAAVVPLATVRGSAQNSKITVGLIGSGNRGTFVAGLMAKNTSAQITAVCDIVDDRMQRAKQSIGAENAKTYRDLHQLLASDVNAVIIATPVYLHP